MCPPCRANLLPLPLPLPLLVPTSSFTPHLGVRISCSVPRSSSPVTGSPGQKYLDISSQSYLARDISAPAVTCKTLEFLHVISRAISGEQRCRFVGLMVVVHVAVLHQVHLDTILSVSTDLDVCSIKIWLQIGSDTRLVRCSLTIAFVSVSVDTVSTSLRGKQQQSWRRLQLTSRRSNVSIVVGQDITVFVNLSR